MHALHLSDLVSFLRMIIGLSGCVCKQQVQSSQLLGSFTERGFRAMAKHLSLKGVGSQGDEFVCCMLSLRRTG